MAIKQYIPALKWLRDYRQQWFAQDLTAALIVTVLLIPQSLAYGMLAGVPPEVGLYASILPLVAYAIFGTSRTLSVGPVAVVSLMTASSLGSVVSQLDVSYLSAAATLALLSGIVLVLMGWLKLGFLTNFLSHSVISGFISASGIIIALNQMKHILGVNIHGDTLLELLPTFYHELSGFHIATLALGLTVIGFLFLSKKYAKQILKALSFSEQSSTIAAKTAPILGVMLSIALVYGFALNAQGVSIVGVVPKGLPSLGLALPSLALVKALLLPAFLISLIGYVESISVGKTLAAKRRQKVDANQELIGLGAANLASAVSGGFPVTGGFSRSIVNFDAGAVTQAASFMTAIAIALTALFLTPALYYLPKATLAATIVVAVFALIDFSILKKTWGFSKGDFWAVLSTIVVTLLFGVELGVSCGVAVSILLHLYRTSVPHIAEVGLIEGTEHFRNVRRYHTQKLNHLLLLRPDESLFFANAASLDDKIQDAVYHRDCIQHVVLQCSAVNEIDYSALEVLELINSQLASQGVLLHLSEVKGPVMDKLKKTGFLTHLSGQVYVSQFEAFQNLKG